MRPLVFRCYLDTALSIALLIVCAPFGLDWVAGSRVVYAIAWFFIFVGFLHRLIGFNGAALAAGYARSATATLASVTPLLLIYGLWQGPESLGLLAMLGGTLAGIVCWLVTLRLTRHPIYAEIHALAAPLLARLSPRSA
jgi:hypothetical protein